MSLPIIIQGGMGVGVSNWSLARTVAAQGQLGVVSGTLLPVVLARRLQLGDTSGNMRRALARFPLQDMAGRVLADWFMPEGKPADRPFKAVEMPSVDASPAFTELTVVANFVEIFLAKEGHSGVVGINLLEKIQLPTLPSLYGAMLAGVDYVLMGAGIPRAIPGALDQLALGQAARLKLDVTAAPGAAAPEVFTEFDPQAFFGRARAPGLKRPFFVAIVSSATLATTLARKSTGRVDGFIVENESAGGHNAPPRGPMQLNAEGEPIYGERDRPDLDKIRALGLPFWVAGSHATPDRLAQARRLGAAGVQIGTAFAFCEESGVDPLLRQEVCILAKSGLAKIHTDPLASPTGFPFKVVLHPGTLASPEHYAARPRLCDLGYLRETFVQADGSFGYRCSGESVANYVSKGGSPAATEGRKCLCNGLLATVGLGQRTRNRAELPLVTAGQEVAHLPRYLTAGRSSYHAADVIAGVLAQADKDTCAPSLATAHNA
jgi:nitronate monooxygenase